MPDRDRGFLITQYPNVADGARQREYEECLRANVRLAWFSQVVLLQEPTAGRPAVDMPQRIRAMKVNARLTFRDAVSMANWLAARAPTLCVLANADVAFDETLALVTKERLRGRVLCLSRDDVVKNGRDACQWSQDAWVFEAPLRSAQMYLDFQFGRPGCDNRFAYELTKAGYEVLNPSLLIHVRHVHAGLHTWTEAERVPGPYAHPPGTEEF